MADNQTVTLRRDLQHTQRVLWEIYDHIGYLRDCAEGYEKEYFNQFRGNMQSLVTPLRDLDNSLSDNRAGLVVHPLTIVNTP